MKKSSRFYQISHYGFSLIQVLISIGVMSIVAMGMLHMFTADQKRLIMTRQMSSRDSIKMLADRYILDSKIITDSSLSTNYPSLGANIEGNRALDYCLNGHPVAPTPQCPALQHPNCCNAVVDQPFHILDPSDSSHTKRFSGTDAATSPFATTSFSPVRYSIDGGICTIADPNCPLELVTTFTAECPGAAPTCDGAERVLVNYALRGAAGITPAGGTPFKLSRPSTPIVVASAAGAGSAILQLKCPFQSAAGTAPSCGHCSPMPCPTGWSDIGYLTAEFVGALGGNHLGNCVRTCTK